MKQYDQKTHDRVQVLSPNSNSSIEAGPIEIDHVAEQKLVRKLDLHILPIVALLYLFSFLDRHVPLNHRSSRGFFADCRKSINIGNARLYGLEDDLGLKGDQYHTALALLFVTYVMFEIPSNLVLKKFTPSRWIAFITTSWGIVATLTGLTQSFSGFIICRLLLGAFESGLLPGLVLYLTLFYSKHEMALKLGYLMVMLAAAGALGGLLAYCIGFMDGVAGQRGWRWILILEGLPTIGLGIASWFLLANDPEHATYLSDQEKELMIVRAKRQVGVTKSAQKLHLADVYQALKDWKVWAFAAAQFSADVMLYGYSIFLPTIIEDFGNWKTTEVQALTIPCYIVGAVSYVIVAKLSDSQQRRGIYCVILGLVSVLGYGLLVSDTGPGIHYFGCFLIAIGLYVVVGIPLAWLQTNQPRYGKKATAGGLQLSAGNCAGIMAPFLYKTSESPRYIRGHVVTLGMVVLSTLIFGFMSWFLARLNNARREGKEDGKIENMADEEIEELGDASPRFFYTV